jgi:hypothetical protein
MKKHLLLKLITSQASTYRIVVSKPEERDHLGVLDVDGKIILKW